MAWGPISFVLGWVVVGVFIGGSTSIRTQDRRYGPMLNQLSEGRHVHPLEYDTTQARAERAIAARPYLIVFGSVLLLAAVACLVFGLALLATVWFLLAAIAYIGVRRADWLLHHQSRWRINE